jgi:hypothetical protein
MPVRHAAALLISGWYLMLPPTNGKNVTQGAPLEKWTNAGVYDSMEDCQNVIGRLQSGLRGRESETRPDAAQCVASDDPRLKGK